MLPIQPSRVCGMQEEGEARKFLKQLGNAGNMIVMRVGKKNPGERETLPAQIGERLREVALRIDEGRLLFTPIQDEINEISEASEFVLRDGLSGFQTGGFMAGEVIGNAGKHGPNLP